MIVQPGAPGTSSPSLRYEVGWTGILNGYRLPKPASLLPRANSVAAPNENRESRITGMIRAATFIVGVRGFSPAK